METSQKNTNCESNNQIQCENIGNAPQRAQIPEDKFQLLEHLGGLRDDFIHGDIHDIEGINNEIRRRRRRIIRRMIREERQRRRQRRRTPTPPPGFQTKSNSLINIIKIFARTQENKIFRLSELYVFIENNYKQNYKSKKAFQGSVRGQITLRNCDNNIYEDDVCFRNIRRSTWQLLE